VGNALGVIQQIQHPTIGGMGLKRAKPLTRRTAALQGERKPKRKRVDAPFLPKDHDNMRIADCIWARWRNSVIQKVALPSDKRCSTRVILPCREHRNSSKKRLPASTGVLTGVLQRRNQKRLQYIACEVSSPQTSQLHLYHTEGSYTLVTKFTD